MDVSIRFPWETWTIGGFLVLFRLVTMAKISFPAATKAVAPKLGVCLYPGFCESDSYTYVANAV